MRRLRNEHKIHPSARRIKKGTSKNNQTSGKSKGIRPSPLQKWMCRHNRSYKHPNYASVMATLGQRKKT